MKQVDDDTNTGFDPTANSWYTPLGNTAVSSAGTVESSSVSSDAHLHRISLMLHRPDEDSTAFQVSRNGSAVNHRQFARCPIVDERVVGILTINGRSVNCRLVEMSIGGFGVVVAGQSRFTNGMVGQLSAPGINYRVSVSRQEGRPGGVYIGLKQLEEILDCKKTNSETPSVAGLIIAGLSGALIVITSYYFMNVS